MREEPARRRFSRGGGFRPRVAGAALPRVRDTFFFSSSFEWGLAACRGRNRVRSGEGPGAYEPTAGVRCAPPGDPASAPLGTPELSTFPEGRGRGQALPGGRGRRFPASPGARLARGAAARPAVGSPGARAPPRLPLPERSVRTPHPAAPD